MTILLTSLLSLSFLMIGYTYFGYPILLWLVARAKAKRTDQVPTGAIPDSVLPTVTLLIAAYNEETSLAAKLENSLSLDYPRQRLQILVAADGSTDGTVAIVEANAMQGVELSYSAQRDGKMAAINRAMARVRGDIVVFSDANNLYASETIRALVTPFTDERVGAVSWCQGDRAGRWRLG